MKIKHTALALATTVFATGAVLAQAPAGVVERPPAQLVPSQAGGMPQAKGEMNANAKGANVGTTATMGAQGRMDMNGDGLISRAEWDAYHSKMWSSMRADKNGHVNWAEVETRMGRGTPK